MDGVFDCTYSFDSWVILVVSLVPGAFFLLPNGGYTRKQ